MAAIPLDKKETITTTDKGCFEKVSVLDKRFMTEINFLQYNAFPIHEAEDSPIQKEWHQEIKILSHDLEMLLALSHEKFWVQLVHDSTLHAMLSTYLQKAPRSWDIWNIPERFLAVHDMLNKLIFLTLLRMSTDKESKTCYLSPEAFGFAIYENYMFDIPKLIDICSLYGHPHGGNGILVNKMLTNVFTKQQSYVDDLKVVGQQLHEQVITNITTKYDSAQTTIGLYDLLCYHYDTCMSLICLFSTYPPTLNYFNCTELIASFGTVYSHVFHNIKAKLKRLSTPANDLQSFKTIINRAQISTVRLIHCVIWHSCLMDQLLDDSLAEVDHTRCAEQFIAQLSIILGDVQLMTKYYQECNLAKTFTIIKNSQAEVGPDHFDYILNAIDIEHSPGRDVKDIDKVHYDKSNHNPVMNGHDTPTLKTEEHPNMQFLIDNIKNIFPQYQSRFLEHCLEAYSYSSEEVITALLENNLPPHLEEIKNNVVDHLSSDDRPGPSSAWEIVSAPSNSEVEGSSDEVGGVGQHPTPQSATKDEPAPQKEPQCLITSRQNVFDNDEFDVFNNPHELNFDMIHIGKKNKAAPGGTGGEPTKDFLFKNPKFNFEYDEYDDEYDDTYDGLVAATGDGTVDQSAEFVIKPLNAPLPPQNDYEGSSDNNGDDDKSKQDKPATRGAYSNRGRDRGKYPQNQKPKQVDKVGQKADSTTLINRKRNEQNKSRRANHNRRAGADKKRRGGMLHM